VAGIVSIAAVCLLIKGGQSPATILREAAIVGIFALFAAALRYVGPVWSRASSLAASGDIASYGARLLAAFLVGRLYYVSTGISELRDAATRMTRLAPIIRRWDIGLVLSMVLSFIPLIFEEWTKSREAARSRGMPRRPTMAAQALFIMAFLRRLMLRAVAIPEALIARGWTRNRGILPLRWRKRDSLSLLACALLLCAALLHIV
jgi:energy-coupling factor transporter transmembrane protein EcfT